MTNTVISVENLSKSYRLGTISTGTFYGDLKRWWAMQRGKPDPYLKIGESDHGNRNGETIWALQDINFNVKQGEALGIIGRNGAGKSTLLKILSQVTAPTSGIVNVKGRIASLLEVGTGFHPELTGRENIFMNGAIMGMNRVEIKRKFDEIVDFSGVEKFIDTPVKRYSSGMYVRLAFAVAAHLDPEILVVDEVLAVGDAEFQKKCLGKMENVASEGRTVLFVSHNIAAIQRLCTHAVLLSQGKILMDGNTALVTEQYLSAGMSQQGERRWKIDSAPGFDNALKLSSIRVLDETDTIRTDFDVKEPVIIEVEYWVLKKQYLLDTHLYFSNNSGQVLFVSMDNMTSPYKDTPHPEGLYRSKCVVPANFLNEGVIRVEYLFSTRSAVQYYVTVPDAVSFRMLDDRSPQGVRGNWDRDWPQSMIRPILHWQTLRIGDVDDVK